LAPCLLILAGGCGQDKLAVRFPAAKSVRASDNVAMAMTEQEWLACNHPSDMLRCLGPKASKRKRRLFVCAACRRIWHLIPDDRSRRAVLVAEQFADGLVRNAQLNTSREEARTVLKEQKSQRAKEWASRACYCSVMEKAGDAVKVWLSVGYAVQMGRPAGDVAQSPAPARLGALMSVWDTELARQAGALRDIFGNPFRPVTLNAAWRTSNVTALAQSIYDDRAFDRLPILADALEDAGCDNADILDHCRQPGEHVRGCWVVDLVLGRE
jgi:hypothetical protein